MTLIRYAYFLIKHVGVPASKITILAPYKGQLFAIRKLLMTYHFKICIQRVEFWLTDKISAVAPGWLADYRYISRRGEWYYHHVYDAYQRPRIHQNTKSHLCVRLASSLRLCYVWISTSVVLLFISICILHLTSITYLPLFEKNEDWRKVLENVDVVAMEGDLQEAQMPQKAVLVCPRHNTFLGSLHAYDVTADGFRSRTVCSSKCGVVCERGMQIYDFLFDFLLVYVITLTNTTLGHQCLAACHDCPGCAVEGSYELPCGHSYWYSLFLLTLQKSIYLFFRSRGRCSVLPNCPVEVQVELNCSHTAMKMCSSEDDPICKKLVKKQLICGHMQGIKGSEQQV